MSAYLHGFGAHLPERVVANAELAERLGCTTEWIEKVSGIQERRWAAPETTVADMGVAAAEDCLRKAGVAANTLGMLIVASGSACARVSWPCRGSRSALGIGFRARARSSHGQCGQLIRPGPGDAAGRDTRRCPGGRGGKDVSRDRSRALDPNTAILFGDGAGAALVSARPGRWRMLDAVLHTDGQYRADLAFDGTGPLRMNGLTVILQAARKIPCVDHGSAGTPEYFRPAGCRFPAAPGQSQPAHPRRQISRRRPREGLQQRAALREHVLGVDADCRVRVVGNES